MTELKAIHTDRAPAAIGTYSQAIQVGNFIFLSGQVPLDPKTMMIVSGGFQAQIKQVFENLKAVAEAANSSLSKTVKLTIYITDFANFSLVNEMMANYFKEPYPARATIQVSALPKNVDVEIDAILME